ncbi:bromodomain-containing protein 8-like [Belonocnema kinseyi]|uniref:bromodomain-containing protein 8-like n=1 Tax=Belonocnema kinseyi TaxID=2817044 RepID=UPI00143D1142|nr:bromodomain-containing protein 8-like [Belonocnema kinseyi]
MASGQERLKLKRTLCDTWSTKEQLCLASSVLKSGDQNWMSVSRCLKSFLEKESQRPPDWFSQKSCAVQYAHLLENSDTPKRKKKECTETTGESIVKRLTQERMTEIGQILASQRDEYQQLKSELNLFKTGNISEEKLQKMYLQIELDEREQEQKGRAHSAWLAKRQKQDAQTPASLNYTIQRKSESSDGHDTLDPCSTDDEDKKNKGGRSPLLTSLLKSPSPTTQIQAQTSSAQVTSPTIASLLGSSPKIPNPQLTQTVSPQLHQLVSTAIANATPERPSAGAPTLSMLLELPANLQRTTLPNLQHHSSTTNLAQQNINLQIMQVENQRGNVQLMEPTVAPGNLSASEIIDHIDKVIPKDIMADVMDKDEINEIIGDIEELIKGEIIQNPQALDPGTARVMETLIPQPPVLPEKQEITNFPVAVSLTDSPENEVAVEEIDSSNSNIAEIIGTVAVEKSTPQDVKEVESKSGEIVEPEISAKLIVDSKNDKAEAEKSFDSTENSKLDIETRLKESKEETSEDATKSSKEDVKQDTTKKEMKENLKNVKENSKKETKENVKENVLQALEDSPLEQSKQSSEKENSNEKVSKEPDETHDVKDMDQLELNLAKITGDQDAPCPEVLSVSSDDHPSAEDTEKSQDISLILEDEVITPIPQEKEKDVEEISVVEPPANVTESSASSKEDVVIKEESGEEEKDESLKNAKEESKKLLDLETENSKKEDKKDLSDKTLNTVIEEDSEDLKKEEQDSVKESEPPKETDNFPSEDLIKDEEIKLEFTKEVDKFREETLTHEGLKDEKEIKEDKEDKKNIDLDVGVRKEQDGFSENVGEIDEEESPLSKLSGGRAMKTYSKRQTVAVDSEPEMEGSIESADYRAWKKAVMLVYNRLATHKYASAFLRPITEDQAPGYHSIIFRPMDLSTIKKNIDNGTIRSTRHFQRDVMLMFQNAIMYNKHDTFVYKMAITMQEECLQHMQILVQVTGEMSFRRETRTAASSSSEASESGVKRKRSHITPSPHDTDSPRGKKRRKSEND